MTDQVILRNQAKYVTTRHVTTNLTVTTTMTITTTTTTTITNTQIWENWYDIGCCNVQEELHLSDFQNPHQFSLQINQN